jgi:hypothetical protein
MAERLAARRRSQFVGRSRELGVLTAALADADSGAVVFVHGPGGIGKSTLLRQYEWLGKEAGRHVVRLDARDVPPVPSAFLAELRRGAGLDPGADDAMSGLGDLSRLLLLVDTAELLAPLDPWLRDHLLPALPGDAVVAMAGRTPPALAWRTDPGWRGMVSILPLSNLSREESRLLLEARGVSADQQAEALAFTRGHPLALALVADVVAQGGGGFELAERPDVVDALLGSIVDTVPSAQHRSALEACAQVLTTTEPLLARLLDLPDAHDMFEWLRGLSFVEAGPRGLFPHDVARDALGKELRWRHPDQYAEIHRRAGACYRDRFAAVPTSQQQQVLVEYVFLHRDNPVLGPLVVGSAEAGVDLRSLTTSAPGPDELALARAIVAEHEGPESADLLEYWTARQPDALQVLRGPDGGVLGLICTLQVQDVSPEDRERDVAVARVADFLDQRPGLAPGQVAGFFRFWMQREDYQDLGPVQLFIALHFTRYYLSTPGLAYSFVYYADPDLWAPVCAYGDLARLPGGDFRVGPREYGIYWHDWTRTPPMAWLALLGEREIAPVPLDIGPAAQVPAGIPTQRLSAEDFATAVREALKELGRADGLRSSPLLRSAPVLARTPPDADDRARRDALRAWMRDAAARLEAAPRDRRAYRALHHTYLQPAPTQAEAAELLALPMSTYRRHLAAGIDRLTEILRHDDQDLARPVATE